MADGTSIGKNKVGPANLFLQSLFSTTEVTLQNKATITRNYNPYRALMQTFLTYGDQGNLSQLQTQGFFLDSDTGMGDASPSGTNTGLYERAGLFIEESKVVDMQGPIFHNLFSMERYILNSTDVKLKLYRNPVAFCILSKEADETYKIDILDIYLLARKVKVNPAVIFGHNEILKTTNVKYPFTRQECRVQSIAQGSTSFQWENMFQGQKPNKIVIGFVKAKAISGTYDTNPFYFENCGITNIGVYVDGLPVGGTPLKLDFDTTDGVAIMRAYTRLLINTGKWQEDAGSLIGPARFVSGSTLFVFQLEPELTNHGDFISLVKTGQVRLDVQFKTGLAADICPINWFGNAAFPYCVRCSQEKDTHANAEERCREMGGELTMINDGEVGKASMMSSIRIMFTMLHCHHQGTAWIKGKVEAAGGQGCLTASLYRQSFSFWKSDCNDQLYAICTRNLIYSEKPTITVDSVYFDKETLVATPPWTPLPLNTKLDRLPSSNEVVVLQTPTNTLFPFGSSFYNLLNSLQKRHDSSDDVFTTNITSLSRTFDVNITFPRLYYPPAWMTKPVNDYYPLEWKYIYETCGYYSFGLYNLNPPRYVETDPVLMRYDESLLHIYLAKFVATSYVVGKEYTPHVSEEMVIFWKLLKDESYMKTLNSYLYTVSEITPWIRHTSKVGQRFQYFKAVVDDFTYSPPLVTLRVFLVPKPDPDMSSDQEQKMLPLVQEYLQETLNDKVFRIDTLEVSSTVACPAIILDTPEYELKITLSSTRIGQVGYSLERCNEGKGALGSALCKGDYKTGAAWGRPTYKYGCQIIPDLPAASSPENLKELSMTDITLLNLRRVLERTVELTKPELNLTEAGVIYTAEILYKTTKFSDKLLSTDLENIYDITNNIIQADPDAILTSQKINNAANRIIRSVDEFTRSHAILSSEESFRVVRSFVASSILSQKGNGSSETVIGLGLMSSGKNEISNSSIMVVKPTTGVDMENTNTAIFLSENVVKGSPTKLAFQIYTKTDLFVAPHYQVISNVAAASLEKNNRQVYHLGEDRITVIFNIKEVTDKFTCGFWDYSANENAGGWRTEGCSFSSKSSDIKIICECNHLTNFAVLIDLNAESISDTHKFVLSLVTKIGLSVSILGLGLTILTFIVFKHLRNGRGQQVLVNLSVAMLCSAVVFLVGMDRVENVTGCKIVAILLHYIILVSFAWMLVEGVLQYLRFVKVLGTYIPRFMLRTMIPAWGFPLIPIIAVLVIDDDLYFGGKGYCWLDTDAMVYAFIIPVGVVLLANILVFVLVLRNLLIRKNKLQTNQSERKMALMHFKAAISVFVVLGLTWIFGFLAVSGAQIVFHYIFAVLNAFQGFFIFILFTAREKRIRNAWKKLCCKARYENFTSGIPRQPLKMSTDTPATAATKL